MTALEPLTPLKQADYPNVKYWQKDPWLRSEKSRPKQDPKAPRKGKITAATYLESADGELISDEERKKLMATARRLWAKYARQGCAPATTFGDATSADVQEHFCIEIATEHPILQLCEGSWKAKQIAQAHYPGWRENHMRKFVDQPQPGKRKRAATSESSSAKKARYGSDNEEDDQDDDDEDEVANDQSAAPAPKGGKGKTPMRQVSLAIIAVYTLTLGQAQGLKLVNPL